MILKCDLALAQHKPEVNPLKGADNRAFVEGDSELEIISASKARLLGILPGELAEAVSLVSDLKGRQVEVVGLLAEGRDNRFIAARMGISESTVKQYVTSIMLRIHVESRLQIGLVGFALKAVTLLEIAEGRTNEGYL
jgi:DNA-binding NarL/FixJ family response regulator